MFENAKVGDRVWDFALGWGTIEETDYDNDPYVIAVRFDNAHFNTYMLDGKAYEGSMPTLFWDEIKFEVPEKPFDLVEFLKENLKIRDFKNKYNKCYIYCNFDKEFNRFMYRWGIATDDIVIGVPYFDKSDKVIAELNNRKIEPEQLKKAFKELGWL